MKIKNKGKVHPSPSSSPPPPPPASPSTTTDPILSTLQLLPATILSLASVLPHQDLQVLSYLLARSLCHSDSTDSSSSSPLLSLHRSSSSSFDCGCFDCYTVYWLRWDSSPNRDLIHRVIDAFEDHLSSSPSGSVAGKSKVGRRHRKDRNGGRDKRGRSEMSSRGNLCSDKTPEAGDVTLEDKGRDENDNDVAVASAASAAAEETLEGSPLLPFPPPQRAGGRRGGGDYKGLARKVLPDVLGILNSRLWNLWSPDV